MRGVNAVVAAGHPATAEAGAEILAEGGSAADAAVGACLASCVAETVMTGLLGGGHAIYLDAESCLVRNLDCFVAVPGLGRPADAPNPELVRLGVPFGTELVHYAVGAASCAVPGVPAGLDALWRAHGRLPWRRLVEPALRLAREGVAMPRAHAACLRMLAPVMTLDAGERIYSPGGRLLETGDMLHQPGLEDALAAVAAEGAASVYSGSLAESLLALVQEREGLVTREDLSAYAARWTGPVEVAYAGRRLVTRGGLARVAPALERLPRLLGRSPAERATRLADVLGGGVARTGHTTNITVIDRTGNACVLTTSLGLGSGDFLPGLDVHLNSMLGEDDLVTGPLVPGERMESMMAPTLALDTSGLELAAGAAGGSRLPAALVQVLSGILDEGLAPQTAIDRPRLHVAGRIAHLEPGFEPEVALGLEANGYAVRLWDEPHHFFGGVSAAGRSGAGADARRSGAVRSPV